MPMHDWTRAGAFLFDSFQILWVTEISRALRHCVPTGCYAMIERVPPGEARDLRQRRQSAVVVRREADHCPLARIQLAGPYSNPEVTPDADAGVEVVFDEYVNGRPMTTLFRRFAPGDHLGDNVAIRLSPEATIAMPLEATYAAAWDGMPSRWQKVVAG